MIYITNYMKELINYNILNYNKLKEEQEKKQKRKKMEKILPIFLMRKNKMMK